MNVLVQKPATLLTVVLLVTQEHQEWQAISLVLSSRESSLSLDDINNKVQNVRQ